MNISVHGSRRKIEFLLIEYPTTPTPTTTTTNKHPYLHYRTYIPPKPMAPNPEDDLSPTKTEGFKVGEKKTIDEYQQLGDSQYFFISSIRFNSSNRWFS